MNRQGAIKGLKITALLAIIAFAAEELSHRVDEFRSNARQMANIAAAERHLPSLQKLLKADGRFDEIELMGFTGSGGSIRVNGTVESEEALQALKVIVLSSNPPVTVLYHASILDPETKKLIEQLKNDSK